MIRDRDIERRRPTVMALAAGVTLLLSHSIAAAEDSPYCQKVRARASSDAALLYAPSLQAQGIKFPNNGTIDSGVTTGAGYQFRAALTWSPLDVYKGVSLKRVGEADCQAHEDTTNAHEAIEGAADVGRLPALKAEIAFLDAKHDRIDAISAKTEERVQAHVASIHDSAEVRSRLAMLEKMRAQADGEARSIAARAPLDAQASLEALVAVSDRDAMKLEREASHVRKISAWDVRLTGGVIPQDTPVDYYGIVQVGFNFGAFSQASAERRYLTARERELASARYELRDQLARFRAEVKASASHARREMELLGHHAEMLAADRAKLEASDAPSVAQALALVELDEIAVQTERTYWTTLFAELTKLENKNGH